MPPYQITKPGLQHPLGKCQTCKKQIDHKSECVRVKYGDVHKSYCTACYYGHKHLKLNVADAQGAV